MMLKVTMTIVKGARGEQNMREEKRKEEGEDQNWGYGRRTYRALRHYCGPDDLQAARKS